MKFNAQTTALLSLDIQKGIMARIPKAEAILPQAARAVEAARKQQFLILHVGLGFEPGYPEVGTQASPFSRLKSGGLFIKDSESAEFHPAVAKAGETIVYKQRYGAFSENSLEMILRAKKIEHLVLMGITTSGVVLSTLRRAFDLDFKCTVIKDACMDNDDEVHRVLMKKVFTAQAEVMTAEIFAAM